MCCFGSVNSYPDLAPRTTAGKPGLTLDAELAERARMVLGELYTDEFRQLYDIALVDIDEVVPGSLDERTGTVTFGEAGPDRYGSVDEIARRVWLAGGRVLAVGRDYIPGRGPGAAIPQHATALS